jgi:methyltransferase (TIGR00027 family)
VTNSSPVSHVSDTARWVAMYRALETERPDALFHDHFARRLAGPQGEEILRTLPKAREFAWPMIVRTAVMDEVILRSIQRDGVDTVVNLAAGLDARPYRLPLPPALRWFEADFPDMLDYKAAQLSGDRPGCALELLRVDLTDTAARRAALEQATAEAKRALVIAEGLLVYLEREQVANLAHDLFAQPSIHYWLIDIAMPRLLQMMEKTWGESLQSGSARFRFAPAEGTAFFQPLGWREAEFHSNWDDSFRLNRTMKRAKLYRFLSHLYPKRMREQFRRFAGVALLERISP